MPDVTWVILILNCVALLYFFFSSFGGSNGRSFEQQVDILFSHPVTPYMDGEGETF